MLNSKRKAIKFIKHLYISIENIFNLTLATKTPSDKENEFFTHLNLVHVLLAMGLTE